MSSERETTNWEAIARYLAGESPAEEQAAVRQWLGEHPTDAKMIAALDDALDKVTSGADAPDGIDVDAALARVKARRGPNVIPMRPRRINWIPAAAAASVVLAAGLWLADRSTSDSAPKTTIAARTLLTPYGRRDSLVLPDGSQVLLGPGSSLILAQGYGQSERRISLQGEALFTVVHDAARPFIVVANGVDIRDIGTAFVVHSDAGGVRVTVTEGVVEFTAGGQVATLNRGDAASVVSGRIKEERGVGPGDDLAWVKGRLVFRDAPLIEVAEDLKRWYGVNVDIRDSTLRHRPFSGTFEGDSLRVVLEVISRAVGATIERRGDTAVVRPAR